MSRIRLLVAAGAVAGIVFAIAVLAEPGDDADAGAGRAAPEIRNCAACHSEIAREVRESYHGQAYTDPEVLALTNNFKDESCISCHAPMPMFSSGIGKRVFARNEGRETGVDCISCHLMPDGRVAGTRGMTDAPCRPALVPALGTANFCAGCHNQHWTVDEFMATRWAETHTCNDCHMERVDRPIADGHPVRKGVATHRMEGGHFPAMLRRGIELSGEVGEGRLVVRVKNSGTGHNLPTDSRHKSFNLLVTVRDRAGNLLTDRSEVAEYRLYYREENRPSTQIKADEVREHVVDLPADRHGDIIVELVYCLKPPQKDTRDWTLVHRLELEF